jgi:hypothetical protein
MTAISDSKLIQPGLTRRGFLHSAFLGGGALLLTRNLAANSRPRFAEGTVFHDRSGRGVRQSGDRGIAGVAVSNGREVTLTDGKGRWRLPIEDEQATFFVIKPSGWMTPLNRDNLPQFHYIHQPEGSPRLRYAGVEPTGPLPESIDFGLVQREEPDSFKALICGDPQPRNAREVGYLAQTVVPQLKENKAAFGVSLGDIMFDDLSLYEPLNQAFGLVGLPWRNVLGNHDLNFDVPDNRHANETFRRVYGPSYYAFTCGPVDFLLLNNVEWMGQEPERPHGTGNYRGHLGARQIEFAANYLKQVPKDRLLVILMHIPLQRGFALNPRAETLDRQKLYRLIEQRPNTLSFSAHTHWHRHLFIGSEDGWAGSQPHHHVITGTLCGSWFRGAPDEWGVPHATMADGTPRGYLEIEFNGSSYKIDGYKALQRPSSHQMNIDIPPEVQQAETGQTQVYVNVFNGSERSKVRLRLAPGDGWRELEKIEEPDPAYLRLFERDRALTAPFHSLPAPANCPHLWKMSLPENLPPGTHLIEVAATDMFGHTHAGFRPFRVMA